jgi:hypothetical protein
LALGGRQRRLWAHPRPDTNFQFVFLHSAEAATTALRPRLLVAYSPLLPAAPAVDGFETGDLAAWSRLAP